MEDNTRFTPSFPGVPHARMPWRSVYVPVVPCVLDGCISLLELIAKLEYIVNSYQAGIEANHTDIVNLAAELEQDLADLRTYIDAQDAATLAAAKTYAEDLRDLLKVYVDTQDTVTLNAAKAYADALDAALRTYIDNQDAATLAAAKTYAADLDTALRTYLAQQLALKQDVLTFDQAPTDGSSNPVTSDGIYDALTTINTAIADKQPVSAFCDMTYNSSTGVWSGNMDYVTMRAYLLQGREIILRAAQPRPNQTVGNDYNCWYRFLYSTDSDTVFAFGGYGGTFVLDAMNGWTFTQS